MEHELSKVNSVTKADWASETCISTSDAVLHCHCSLVDLWKRAMMGIPIVHLSWHLILVDERNIVQHVTAHKDPLGKPEVGT